MTTKLERATERSEARERLLEVLTPGDTVYTVMTHVSRSGMSRSIDLLIGRGRDVDKITYWASRAMGDDKGSERIDQKNGGIVVPGCGMDMGFHLVYGLSRTLWPNGFDCVGPVYYLTDNELEDSQYPHIRRVRDEQGDLCQEVYAAPLTDGDGFLPGYLSTRHTCPSNDHNNHRGNSRGPFHHSDGGYALQQRWL